MVCTIGICFRSIQRQVPRFCYSQHSIKYPTKKLIFRETSVRKYHLILSILIIFPKDNKVVPKDNPITLNLGNCNLYVFIYLILLHILQYKADLKPRALSPSLPQGDIWVLDPNAVNCSVSQLILLMSDDPLAITE